MRNAIELLNNDQTNIAAIELILEKTMTVAKRSNTFWFDYIDDSVDDLCDIFDIEPEDIIEIVHNFRSPANECWVVDFLKCCKVIYFPEDM